DRHLTLLRCSARQFQIGIHPRRATQRVWANRMPALVKAQIHCRGSRADRSRPRLATLTYVAWQSRRRQQVLELAPALLGLLRRAAAFLDVRAHHVFAETIVNDIAAAFLDEFCGLLRLFLVHERV